MRRSNQWARRAALIAGALLPGLALPQAPAEAQQPFGFLFGSPPQYRHRPPPRHRAPRLPRDAAIPLPVPRPHFPGDPPLPGETAATSPAADVAKRPAAPTAPPGTLPGAVAPAPVAPTPTAADAARHVDVPPPPGPLAPIPPEKPAELKPTQAEPGPSKPEPSKLEPSKLEPSKLEPSKPAAPSQPANPTVAPSGARLGEAPGQPDEDAACPGRLKDRNVVAESMKLGPQPDPRCTVVQAVRLTGLTLPDGGKVDFPDRPTIACTTADVFSSYVRDLLSPLAKGTYGAPVGAVWTGPGLECRSRDHIFGAKLSAHGQGLAIDIARLKLNDGKMIEVGSPKTDADTGFETAARAAACGYFHTVLGPGSDSYHRTHWHFDLEVRGAHGDSKYCK